MSSIRVNLESEAQEKGRPARRPKVRITRQGMRQGGMVLRRQVHSRSNAGRVTHKHVLPLRLRLDPPAGPTARAVLFPEPMVHGHAGLALAGGALVHHPHRRTHVLEFNLAD